MAERLEGREPIVHMIRKGVGDLEVYSALPYKNNDRLFQTSDSELALKVFRKEREKFGLNSESPLPVCLPSNIEKTF